MAFWNELSKKASETTAKAVQQAKVLSETVRLNSLISDEEKKINDNYCEIGKLYVSMHQSDCEEDFAAMIEAIAESEQKINDYRTQIQDVKGVVTCEKCGAEIPKEAAFCSSCGAPIPKVEVVDVQAEEVDAEAAAEEESAEEEAVEETAAEEAVEEAAAEEALEATEAQEEVQEEEKQEEN